MKLHFGAALVAVAAAMTFSQSSFAEEKIDASRLQEFDLSTLTDIKKNPMADDIYADFSMTSDVVYRPGGPGGPDRPGGPGHPGGPGGGPGWGPGPGHPPGPPPPPPPGGPGWGPGPRRGVECSAYNRRGQWFYGRARDMRRAQDEALNQCYRYSRQCFLDRCRPL